MKQCPFCAEEIQDEAIKCKHCGEFLDASVRPSPGGERRPWYFRTTAIVIAVCCVGPLALPMIWWRPRTPLAWKVALTIVILILTWVTVIATRKSMDVLQQYYELMTGF